MDSSENDIFYEFPYNYLRLSLILSEWILRWDCFFWILLSVLNIVRVNIMIRLFSWSATRFFRIRIFWLLSLILSEWILRWDCFFWILLSVLNIVRVNIIIRLFSWSEIRFFRIWIEYFDFQHIPTLWRILKLSRRTSSVALTSKAYQFSVITVQELAKPDKPPKILQPPYVYHSYLFRTTLISQKFSISNWHAIPMTVFLFLMKSIFSKLFSELIHAYISSSTNPFLMLYTFCQTKCKFYSNSFHKISSGLVIPNLKEKIDGSWKRHFQTSAFI